MDFFKIFRNDWNKNVIKRTPPSRLFKLLKSSSRFEEDYTNIFETIKNNLLNPDTDEYSSILRPLQLAYQTVTNQNREHHVHQSATLKDDLSVKKIDPCVVTSALAAVPKVNKKVIINLINHLHFTGEQVSIHIQDKITREEFFLQGESGPFVSDKVEVKFADPDKFDIKRHVPLNLAIDNRKSLIVFPVDQQSICREALVLRLPEMAHSYSKRQAVRHTCEGITAEIVQGLINIKGFLEDINPQDLKVHLVAPANLNSANHLFLKLSRDDCIYFMGKCRILRSDHNDTYIILQPVHNSRPVLSPRKYPNARVRITPQPIIHFTHPLCGLAVQNKVEDISASGFSVIVPDKESLLIPGMVIPQMTLQLPGMISSLQCAAQVIYRRKQKKNMERYGFYILDMSLHDQRRLYDAVSKAVDPHVNLTGKVNMNSLWELFFGSGFIYPDKYGIISAYTAALKETYRKLYEEGQDIFTHLTYQDQGQVFAHMSMVKTYEESWIIHHLAAVPMRGVRTGLRILNHFVNYMDCLYRLPVHSKTMRYNFCYYRPENKFSDYYFGGVYRTFKRRDMCSMDLFGYMSMSLDSKMNTLPEGWSIDSFSHDDLMLMRDYYDGIGGGMMLDAYALECRASENSESSDEHQNTPAKNHNNITSMYSKIGLRRESKVFSVRHHGQIKAAIIVDVSDMGVNMSELLNSIKVIVTDNTLPWPILQEAVSRVGKVYETDTIWVLIFPFNYLGHQGVDCKKRYYFWVLNTDLVGNGMDVIKDHVRIVKRRFITDKFISEIAKRRKKRLMEKLAT